MSDDLTAAQRGGAAPLDTSPDNPANARVADVRRRSSTPPEGIDDADLEIQIIRRRRMRRTGKRWFIGAGVTLLASLAMIASSFVTESSVTVSTGFRSKTLLGTPIASARRVPGFVVEPVASRNLTAALQPVFAKAPPSTCVEFRDGPKAVASRNPTMALIPASNLKIVTTVAAVELLGAETRLQTRFLTDGKPTDGSTVKGNLYMIGGGDPLLTSDSYAASSKFPDQPVTDLEATADKIVATGIRHITGSVVGDGSRYDSLRGVESWPNRYFSEHQVGPLSALIVDDGWTPGIGPTGDPSQHAAAAVSELLKQRGVTIDGAPVAGVAPEGASALIDVPSLTIGELAAQALRYSDNTTTELLLKEIGKVKGGTGSTSAGIDSVMAWAKDKDYPLDGVVMHDGSGLSRENRATCALLSSVLSSQGPDSLIASGLAVPGQPGTLKDRFGQAPLRESVRAKTGTLNSVTSLSGWLTTSAAKPIDFAILINVEGRGTSNADMALQSEILSVGMTYPQAPDTATLEPLPVRTLR